MRSKGFTLIELLIVVLIIAILAAIAVPNFLEFQARAKVSRARSDLRAITTALEAYCVDHDDYPRNSLDGLAVIPTDLTTPIAYLSTKELIDPFAKPGQAQSPLNTSYYTYNRIVTNTERIALAGAGYPPPVEAIDHPIYNAGAFGKYGKWRMVSKGPDGLYADTSSFPGVLYGSDILYDPTNGTASFGNLLRTQKHPEGRLVQ